VSISTEGLARICAGHPKRTLFAWLGVMLVSFVVIALLLGSALTSDGDVTSNPDSKQAEALIQESFPPEPTPSEIVIVRSDRYTVDAPAFRAKVKTLGERGERPDVVADTQNYYASQDQSLVSKDRHATMVPIVMRGDEVIPLVDLVKSEDGQDGFQVSITGSLTADADFERLSEEDLQKGELLIGLPAALVILLLVFGAVVAGLVPVLLGLLSIVIAVALTALVGQAFEVSFFVVNMISAMGLALGIDYALFILSRYREERVRGLEKIDAIVASGATASRAVLFSGIAFVLAMFGMLLVPDTILRSLALGAILVGIVSVLAALTLLPAVLSLLGDRVNALRIPVIGRRAINSAGSEGRFWLVLVGGVMRRPLVSLAAATALLLAAAVPVLSIDTGASGLSTLPDRFPSKQGFDALNRDFPGTGVDPAQIVVEGDLSSPPIRSAIEELKTSFAAQDAFGPPT
jgi:RND superfamily putative drug exporter